MEPAHGLGEHALRGFDRRTKLVVGALVWALLFAFATPGSDAQLLGNDALHYAHSVASGAASGILLANHLLPHVAAWCVYTLAESVGLVAHGLEGALAVQQALSALGAAFATVLVLCVAERVAATRALALCAAALFASAATTLLYGAVGETYLPAAAAELWVVAAGLTFARTGRGRTALAAAFALALLVRADALLVATVPLVLLGVRALRPLVFGGLVAFVCFAVAYTAVPEGASFMQWFGGIATSSAFGVEAARVSFTSGLGWHALMLLDAFAFGAHAAMHTFTDVWPALAALALLLATFVFRGGAAPRSGAPRFVPALLVFVALRFAFFAWWQPTNIEYAASHVAPLVLVAAATWRASALVPTALAALALFGANVRALVVPFANDGAARDAARAVDTAGAQGAVVALDLWGLLALDRELARRSTAAHAASVPTRVDAVAASSPTAAAAVAEVVRAHLAAGAVVVAVRDGSFQSRLALPVSGVHAELGARLGALAPFERAPSSGALTLFVLEAVR
jgi:hypothetical protein